MTSPSDSCQDALTKFRQRITEHTRTAICQRPYVLTNRLKRDHLQEEDIEKLLAEIYRGHAGTPISARTICRHSRVVFIILLDCGLTVGLSRVIKHFQELNIDDGKLPIDRDDLYRRIRSENVPEDIAHEIANQFCETQWKFCAYVFGNHESITLSSDYILPICDRKPIKEGGTAQLTEIVVLEDFVSESLRNAVPKSGFVPVRKEDMKEDGKRYVFALKTFIESKQHIWQCEKEAFNGLRRHEGIVQCLVCFKQLSPSRTSTPQNRLGDEKPTFNILLEFGELDLEDYFYSKDPPSLQQEMEDFWDSLFPVAEALDGLHNFTSHHVNEVYKGWHADIKPANILSIHGDFRLADPGFAKLEQVRNASQVPETELTGGTWTYGAPERLLKRSVTQAIDIWSLGCVFSEAVTWLVGGPSLIKAFIDVRKGAAKAAPFPPSDVGNAKSRDCFHDGRAVLQGVLDWHKMLRHSIRRNDHITESVLDLIETKMLVAAPAERITAQQLARELFLIKEKAQKQARFPMPENIMEALLAADEEGSHEAYDSMQRQRMLGPETGLNRSERKSMLLKSPHKKTAQRAEYLKSALGSSETIKGAPRSSIDSAVRSTNGSGTTNDSSHVLALAQVAPGRIASQSHSIHRLSTGSGSRTSLTFNPTPQAERIDVFKAQEMLEKKKLSSFVKKSFGMDRRDEKLSRHFQDRDLIFLVDNAPSMLPYWSQAKFLLKILVELLTGQDKNGLDLLFTSGTEALNGQHSAESFGKVMNKSGSMPARSNTAGTDMADALGRIFDEHLHRLRMRLPTKLLTIIVFTDGLWAGMKNKHDIKDKIATFVREVTRNNSGLRTRPVSIQFVQFGRDLPATLLLRALDDEMEHEYHIDDVIDLEPADGDVYKMILGSFVYEIDRRETNPLQSPTSERSFSDQSMPQSPQQLSSPDTESALGHFRRLP